MGQKQILMYVQLYFTKANNSFIIRHKQNPFSDIQN